MSKHLIKSEYELPEHAKQNNQRIAAERALKKIKAAMFQEILDNLSNASEK